jgi:hypothetical protein
VTRQLRLHPDDLDGWTREIRAEGVCDPALLLDLAESASYGELIEMLSADARIVWFADGTTREETDERCERLRSGLEASRREMES